MSIEGYKFSDRTAYIDDDSVESDSLVVYNYHSGVISINKEDAIALSRHFGVTAEDLDA